MNTRAGKSIEALKSKGHRITRVRSLLLEVLQDHPAPLTVAELMKALHRRGVKPNKTTLYRELAFLVNEGLVLELDFGEGKKRYESAAAGHHHHLVCLNCHSIEELELGSHLNRLEEKIGSEHNFQVIKHSLEFFGLCENCQP